MFPVKQYRYTFLVLPLALTLLAVGCGKDKSLDDYQQDKANANFAKLQAVSGTYRGTLTNKSNGQPMGAVEIKLNPVINGNGSSTTPAGLQGGVSITVNSTQTSGVITTASFLRQGDSDTSGTINGQISVAIGSGSTPALLALNGTMAGASFNGEINLTDRPGVTAQFNTVKDAPLPRGQGQVVPGMGGAKTYAGSMVDHNCDGHDSSNLCRGPHNGPVSVPVKLTINNTAFSAGYIFVNLFADLKVVNVQVVVDGAVLPLPSCELNQRSGTLHFQGVVPGSTGSSTQASFDCQSRGAGYHCNYHNDSFVMPYEFDVDPTN